MNHSAGRFTQYAAFRSTLSAAVALVIFILSNSPSASAIPAFARKYGLPCSACHEAWPKLNSFGQMFRDNGYQIMNDRDAPIWQQPAYFPITMRITPQWHREYTNRMAVDGPANGEAPVTTSGFDLSGVDIWTGGTLYKNVSFILLPSSDSTASFHFESAFVRFDNILKSNWLNVKFGKFELDNGISEKRMLTLSNNGGSYQIYHFLPPGESTNPFGLGDNQLGMEIAGHSKNSYTRYSVALLSSNDGNVNLPSNHAYDTYLTFSQAFQVGALGLQRVGAYGYIGNAPTVFLASGGVPIPGSGSNSKPFYRAGFFGDLYIKNYDLETVFMHGSEDKFLATNTPGNGVLPTGARDATWNGVFFESHYTLSPQLIFINRYELVRMSQQSLPSTTSDLGNVDALTFAIRWYPFMSSRAGLAIAPEYSQVRSTHTAPVTGRNLVNSSLGLFVDFDF